MAIPAAGGGYHLAVLLTLDRIGVALGLLRGTFPVPRVEGAEHRHVRPRPVYSDGELIEDGTWQIVGHDEGLLRLFPSEPEIYHAPGLTVPGIDFGEFDLADLPTPGRLRQVSREEAEEVGLLDGSYRQLCFGL